MTPIVGSVRSLGVVAILLLGGPYGVASASTRSSIDYPEGSSVYTVERLSARIVVTEGFAIKSLGLNVWYPRSPGRFPLVVLVGGLNGFLPADGYKLVFEAMVAKGLVVVVPGGKLLAPQKYRERAEEVIGVIEWMKTGLEPLLASAGQKDAPQVDVEGGLVLASHSSGAQAVVEIYRSMLDQVSALVFLDPVDGGPYQNIEPSIKEGDRFEIGTPVLILGSQLCMEPGVKAGWWPPCCPEGYSHTHFWNAFASPKWYVNARNYGHADFLAGFYAWLVNTTRFCKEGDKEYGRDVYRAFVAGTVYSFIDVAVSGDWQMIDYLEDAAMMPVAAEAVSQRIFPPRFAQGEE